jgi:hypothetical protein
MTFPLHIGHGAIQRRRDIDVEQRPIKPLHNSDAAGPGARPRSLLVIHTPAVRLAMLELLVEGPGVNRRAARLDRALFNVHAAHQRLVALDVAVLAGLGLGGRRVAATYLGDGEDGFPAVRAARVGLRRVVAEAGGRQRALRPPAVDGSTSGRRC